MIRTSYLLVVMSAERCREALEFATTQWSVVLDVRSEDPLRAQAALARLCERYWYPLYAFARRSGYAAEDAEDTTQAFFAHLLSKEALARVDRGKGLFRTFLLTSLTNFIRDEKDRQHAAKRGGKHQLVSWDALAAEEMYQHESMNSLAPERLFERRWALTLVRRVLERLQSEFETEGKGELFESLEPCLTGDVEPGFYARTAARLQTTEGSVRVSLHRLRRRLGELLRHEIAHTVAASQDVEEEIRYLFSVLDA